MDRFKVELDKNASSPNPQVAIWHGQHICVSEDSTISSPPDATKCGEIIVKHQLEGDRGHYSVLNMAFVKFNCYGFPHSVIAQVTRHQDQNFLVQSGRYTGKRFIDVAEGKRSIEDVFYIRPNGEYRDREGERFVQNDAEREIDEDIIVWACQHYTSKILRGCPYEMARSIITYDHRQDFTISGTLEAMWHFLDRRSAKCSQLEIQKLSELIMEHLDTFTPELSAWYRKHRWSKARLAP